MIQDIKVYKAELEFFTMMYKCEIVGRDTLRAMIARTFMQPCRRSLIGR